MQRFVCGIVFLSQTSAVDALSTTTWPGLILAMIGGSAGVAVLHKIIAEHLREKREDARRQADEEKLARDIKRKAESDERETLVALARSVPAHMELLHRKQDAVAAALVESNHLLSTRIEANTHELAELRREMASDARQMASDARELLKAMAYKMGVQSDETNLSRRASSPGQQHASLP